MAWDSAPAYRSRRATAPERPSPHQIGKKTHDTSARIIASPGFSVSLRSTTKQSFSKYSEDFPLAGINQQANEMRCATGNRTADRISEAALGV